VASVGILPACSPGWNGELSGSRTRLINLRLTQFFRGLRQLLMI
jgi:hypothetical protein